MKDNLKKGIMLFCFFFKIGCFTFGGGWSILAQMEQEFVEKRKMISKEELMDLVTVGRSIPGIMITNISMLFGYQVGGVIGGVCTVIGISCPAILILTLVTIFYDKLKSSYWCYSALKGIQAAVIPIVGSAAISLGKDILADKKGKIIFVISFLLCLFTGVSNIAMILIGIGIALLLRLNTKIKEMGGR